jgi:hypothetical protein
MLDKGGKNFQSIRAHDELMVVGAYVLGDAARVVQLAEILFFETDGKSLHRLA